MIEYTIDENGIICVVFTGEIEFTSIVRWLARFSEIPNLPPDLRLLYDLRNARFNLDTSALMHIAERSDIVTQKYKCICTAFLIDHSKLGTYKKLFSFLKENERTIRKAYSNFDDAYKWLLGEKKESTFC